MSLIDEVREALRDYVTETGMDAEQCERINTLSSRLEGMAIVPVEPTGRMVSAGIEALGDRYAEGTTDELWDDSVSVYRAMLAAVEDK